MSTKLRFEVFKRDGFKCQYCGVTPDKQVLQVDHINPVAKGGKNDIDNLVTSCQPCNIGKGANSLASIPVSLKEKSEQIAEQEKQIKQYQKIIMSARKRKEDFAWSIAEVFDPWARDGYSRANLASIRSFLEKLPYEEVLEAADIATSKGFKSKASCFSYFCGVCWRKIRSSDAE